MDKRKTETCLHSRLRGLAGNEMPNKAENVNREGKQRKSTAIFKNTFKTHLENSEMPTKRISQKRQNKKKRKEKKRRKQEKQRAERGREREGKQNNVNAERQTLGQLSRRVVWRGVWGWGLVQSCGWDAQLRGALSVPEQHKAI